MSENDFKIIKNPGLQFVADVSDRTTSTYSATIKAGEPVGRYAAAVASATSNFVLPIPNGAPEVGSDLFVGVAVSESTETSTLDGKVDVVMCVPAFTVLRAKVTTSANIDTASELLGLMFDWVTGDKATAAITTGAHTIDEDAGDDPNKSGFCIIGGDTDKYTADVIVHGAVSIAAPLVGQTID